MITSEHCRDFARELTRSLFGSGLCGADPGLLKPPMDAALRAWKDAMGAVERAADRVARQAEPDLQSLEERTRTAAAEEEAKTVARLDQFTAAALTGLLASGYRYTSSDNLAAEAERLGRRTLEEVQAKTSGKIR